MPFFSILIATRDRPALFGEALASVLAQDFDDVELVVVDDGSAETHRPAYEAVLGPARARLGDRLREIRLVHRPNGHGSSYALNVAAAAASGDYLACLDDDDCWTDKGHLARAARSLRRAPGADLYTANQAAFLRGEPLPDGLWLAALAPLLAGRAGDEDGTWHVRIDDLIAAQGFCHLNCLIVRRGLWEAVGGLDEAIRWENDRDFYIRLIDAATGPILHNPAVVSRHNVPDPARTDNITTSIPQMMKRLHQLRVADKTALFSRHPALREEGRRERGFALQKLARDLARAGDRKAAAHYARSALADTRSAGVAARAALYTLKALLAR
ncbi:glycosyltransferase [Sphingomonas parva]|uniref:Glycosyltransferase n=1 Tax=Sphingomonas parva TaxID=2555898 RepID=A0A4Y8ZS98_9SPHN|nr:glycosyltransferase family 2 protein [Sphingomonas parva]TFI57995.1 glycosyltransferase [Sphingomonas parva]